MPSLPMGWRSLATMLVAVPALVSSDSLGAQTFSNQSLASVLSSQPGLSKFRSLVNSHPDIFSNFHMEGVTILAPNDFAFDKVGNMNGWDEGVVSSTLWYHILTAPLLVSLVVKGDTLAVSTKLTTPTYTKVTGGQQVIFTKRPGGEAVFTSGFATRSTVVAEDLIFDHGIIQVIDTVMRIPEPLEATTRFAYRDMSIFFSTLAWNGLLDEFTSAKDVTIFAPQNSAFQALVSLLGRMSQDEIRPILRHHLVPNSIKHSWEFLNESSVRAADNTPINITRSNNYIYASPARLLQTDILLSNGVVHMIDNVLSPNPALTQPDVTANTETPPTTECGHHIICTHVAGPTTDEDEATTSDIDSFRAPELSGSGKVAGAGIGAVLVLGALLGLLLVGV